MKLDIYSLRCTAMLI